jgi:hypothetical protein
MPSHAPLCGINRPHARHWSRTNRIDPILELPPVTSDTVVVPPPTRSSEPKVTRYIVIRNDQHDGSSHQGKIFIVAGNRPAALQPPEKQQSHSVTIQRAQASPPRPPAGPVQRIFGLSRPAGAGVRNRPGRASGMRRPSARPRSGPPGDPPSVWSARPRASDSPGPSGT